MEDHVAAALCYLFGFITGIIFLAWSPYNQSKNVRFHAYQSILLTVAWLLVHFMIALFIPFGFRFTLGPLVQIAGMLLWLFMMWKTYTKERIVLPVIGPIAEKQS
ncbi:MAG: hypothetical protein FJW20_17435 [Acidimicrobiia bacterium]|nr:hypothetical protein [Acidimicrobiia bacterium]